MPSANTYKSGAKRKSTLIAIAGPSGAGKTTLARALVAALPSAVLFSFDAYYADRSHLPTSERTRCNFDDPAALDTQLLTAHLRALAVGRAIDGPIYDFSTHCRRAETRRIEPASHIVAEGLFALYFDALRPLYSQRIYVDADAELCLQRRLQRDAGERGRSTDDIRRQYREQVLPMAQRYIYPTRRYAHVVLSGRESSERAVATLLPSIAAENTARSRGRDSPS
jgi:uridine kinase